MIASNRTRPPQERLEIQEIRLKDAHAVVALKGSHKLRIGKYYHIMACLDIYAVFHNLCDSFALEYVVDEGLVADIRMEFRGIPFYLEIHLGTQDIDEVIIPKIEKYRTAARTGEKVIYALHAEAESRIVDPVKREERMTAKIAKDGNKLLDYLEQQRLGNFVSITRLSNFIKYPLGNVLHSPKDGDITLPYLCSQSSLNSSSSSFQ